ncbi:hypothetical protein HCA63_01380 [Listeria booriae]|uniref:ABC transporter permease subunit n=1 Tax=Listeria booriae TaxID=1552123 RepID=UPI001626133F|nr:ABC transporter permease subunit [Listeria booriae]MBC1886992.1 hypothetical protein [Listeria booriae]
MNLLRFESKKFLTSRKNIALIILSAIIVVCNYLLITVFNDNAMQRSFYEMQASELSNSVAELESIVESEPAAKTALEITKQEAEIVSTQVTALNQEDWSLFLKKQIEYDKLQLKGMELGTIPLEESQIRDIHKNIAQNTYLYDNELKPEIAGTDKQGINYTFTFLKTISPFILLALIIFLTIDILNSEKTNGTRDFFNSLPYNKLSLLHSKIFIYLIYAFLLVFFMSILAFIIGSIFNGVGNFNYPVVFQGLSADQVFVFTISTWILKYLSLTFFVILFIILLITLISTIVQMDFIVLTATLIIILLPSVLNIYIPAIQSYSELLPASYLNFNSLFTGNTLLSNNNITYLNSLFCFLGYSIFLYLLSIFIVYRRKKI